MRDDGRAAALDLDRILGRHLSEEERAHVHGFRQAAPGGRDYLDLYGFRSRLCRALVSFAAQRRREDRPGGTMPAIPRRIVQFWDSPEIPSQVQQVMRSWQEMHPGFEYRLFDAEQAASWIAEAYGPDFASLFAACGHPAMKSDFFRFLVIHRMGGIYVDADECCLAPLDSILDGGRALILGARAWDCDKQCEVPPVQALGAEDGAPGVAFYLNNAPVMGAPGHPALSLVVERSAAAIAEAVRQGQRPSIAGATSPQQFTQSILLFILREGLGCLDGIDLLEGWYSHQVQERWLDYKNTEMNWRSEGA